MKIFNQIHEMVLLLREQNSLMRELVSALGQTPRTPKVGLPSTRQFTKDDVVVVTKARREAIYQEQQRIRENGPAFDPTSRSEPSKSNGADGKPPSSV